MPKPEEASNLVFLASCNARYVASGFVVPVSPLTRCGTYLKLPVFLVATETITISLTHFREIKGKGKPETDTDTNQHW